MACGGGAGWDRGDKVQVHVKWCRCERSGAEAMKRCGSNEAVQVHGMVRVSVRRCRCGGSDGAENAMRELFEERLSVFYSVSHLVR